MMTASMGVCPVCNGTKRKAAGDHKYKEVTATYDKATDTFACTNCGAQTMSLTPTGTVYLRADGSPCVHEYTGTKLGNCYWGYKCKHCPDSYAIDSGD